MPLPTSTLNSNLVLNGGDMKALSFTIGSSTLTTAEFTFLDGQDQAVKTNSSPTFANITDSGIGATQILYGGTAGLLTGNAGLVYSGGMLTISQTADNNGLKIFGFTTPTSYVKIGVASTGYAYFNASAGFFDFYNAAGNSISFRVAVNAGTQEDASFSGQRNYTSGFVFATPASASGKQFLVRGAGGNGTGDKAGFWCIANDPKDWFEVNKDATFAGGTTKLMGNAVVGDGTVLGAELLTNGDFSAGSTPLKTGWTLGTGWAWAATSVTKTYAVGPGALTHTAAPLTIGKCYKLSYTLSGTGVRTDILTITAGGQTMPGTPVDNGVHVWYFIATATTGPVITSSQYTAYTIDDVSVKEVTGGTLQVCGLTSGRVPYVSTGGLIVDASTFTFDGTTLTAAAFAVGASAGIDATVPVAPVLPATVAGSMTFKKGILTAYTAPS